MTRQEAYEKHLKEIKCQCTQIEGPCYAHSREGLFFAGWEAAEKQRNQSCLCDKCHEVACECNE